MHLKHKMAAAVLAALAMATSSAADAASGPTHAMHAGRDAHRGSSQGLMASPDCDPFSDWDSEIGTTNDLSPDRPAPMHGRGATMHGAAAQVIGTTPEAIHRNFLKVVTQNLANAGTATRVARLSDRELAAIARHAARGAPAERAGLLKLFAQRLDGRSLVRIARAFGRAPTEAAVRAYAGKATRDAFDGEVAGIMAPPDDEGGGGGTGGTSSYPTPSPPRPTVDMTLEEIYLEYRTAPIGSLSPAGALAETSQFAGVRLSFWLTVGTGIGTGISWLLEHYAPDVNDAIGGTISNMIENFWEASGQIQEGQFEAAIDQLLGFPVTTSSDPWGDWDIDAPMMDSYQSTHMCGF
jgi:hypothetical protein